MTAVKAWAAAALLLAACGRLEFDAHPARSGDGGGRVDGGVDGAVAQDGGHTDAGGLGDDAGTPGPCEDVADGSTCPSGTCLGGACVPPEWAVSIGGAGGVTIGTDVAADRLGNVYTTLRFDGTINLGGETFTTNGGDDILVVAFGRDGTLRWTAQVGGLADDSSWSISAGPDGNVYVGAAVRGDVDLGFGTTSGGGSADNTVLSFTPDGTRRWAIRVADPGFGSAGDSGFDRNGNVYFAGTFFGTGDFGGGPVSSSSADGYDGKIWSLTAEGEHRSFAHWGVTGTSAIRGVAVDSNDNIFFAMLLAGTVDIGGGLLRSPAGRSEVVFGSVDASGAHRWSFAGGGGGGLGQNVTVDSNDDVYCVGNFSGTISLGGLSATSAGCNDGLLASFSSDGSPRWIRPFASPRCDVVREAVVGQDDSIYVTGTVGDAVDVGGGTLPHGGGDDIVVARFNSAGDHLWSTALGGPGEDNAYGIALGPDGDVVVAGAFDGPVDFGQGTITPANRDAYVVRLNPGLR